MTACFNSSGKNWCKDLNAGLPDFKSDEMNIGQQTNQVVHVHDCT